MANPQSVLISGASSGIGRACALHLARRGFQVIAGVRKPEDGIRLESEARQNLKAILLDITDAASVASARLQIETMTGDAGLRALINNAGIAVAGPLEHVTLDEWRMQFEVNVFGHVALTQVMLPLIRRGVAQNGVGSGRIVFIGSIAGRVTLPILGPYSASKHAIASVATSLRQEVRAQGIQVSLLEPGAIQSDIWKKGDDYAATIGADHPSRVLYNHMIDAIMQQSRDAARSAIPAERVARLVEECLTRESPPFRTTVGRDAKIAALLKWALPEKTFYTMIGRKLKVL